MTNKKILFINGGIHYKNMQGLRLLKNIQIDFIDSIEQCIHLNEYEFVYFPCQTFDVSKYPDTKFVFGPHLSILPNEEQINIIKGVNSIYTQPSQWAVDVWKLFPCCHDLQMKPMPFCVDTETFCPNKTIEDRKNVMVYFKDRNYGELENIISLLNEKGYSYQIFNYKNRYYENEFIDYLKNSKFGIWIGRHESQGFALEESLACDIPLLVWDVTSMNQEEGSNYPDYKATCIPYWDENCGEVFYDNSQLLSTFEIFISNLHNYKPREFILNHLSSEVCENIMNSLFS